MRNSGFSIGGVDSTPRRGSHEKNMPRGIGLRVLKGVKSCQGEDRSESKQLVLACVGSRISLVITLASFEKCTYLVILGIQMVSFLVNLENTM